MFREDVRYYVKPGGTAGAFALVPAVFFAWDRGIFYAFFPNNRNIF